MKKFICYIDGSERSNDIRVYLINCESYIEAKKIMLSYLGYDDDLIKYPVDDIWNYIVSINAFVQLNEINSDLTQSIEEIFVYSD